MNVALLCIGVLGLLQTTLGLLVSTGRLGPPPAADDEAARVAFSKRQRAHGNAAEWIPLLAILILATAWLWGGRVWIEAIWIFTVVTRLVHAAGMYSAKRPDAYHPLKFLGATMTYLVSTALAVATIAGVLLRSSSVVSQ